MFQGGNCSNTKNMKQNKMATATQKPSKDIFLQFIF